MAALTCAICNGADAKFCSLCRSISYCSSECQKTDWPLHKTICKTFITLPSRPSPSHKLAILFPVNSKVPQLVWVNCERHVDEVGIAWEMPETLTFLQAENLDRMYGNITEYKEITRSVLRGFNLSHTVQVIGRETFLIDGSTPNVCIRQTTRGKMAHDWRGPIVVMRQPGTAMDPRLYEDIRGGDFRVAVDYFLSYGKGS
jgi:hypothetical protein